MGPRPNTRLPENLRRLVVQILRDYGSHLPTDFRFTNTTLQLQVRQPELLAQRQTPLRPGKTLCQEIREFDLVSYWNHGIWYWDHAGREHLDDFGGRAIAWAPVVVEPPPLASVVFEERDDGGHVNGAGQKALEVQTLSLVQVLVLDTGPPRSRQPS